MPTRTRRLYVAAIAFLAIAGFGLSQAIDPAALDATRTYIKHTWRFLERSNKTLLKSALDTKVGQAGELTLYVARDENPDGIAASLRQILSPADMKRIKLRQLPPDPESIAEAGLLYLPHPYVVPGGRFNEMYGWDSYFTLLGLIEDGELQLAKDMTENFIYEIQHYGMILNANRTYYLTRSQPPFLTQMILDVFRVTGDINWLASTVPAIEKYYAYWVREPHLTPSTGLSHYDGGADTPAPEVVHGERDRDGKNQYDRVREYYRTHQVTEYDVSQYYDRSTDRLKPLFYVGDRAMRESGFDPSARFGPFSVDIIHYNSVDLNSLLYRMELDASAIMSILDRPREATAWAERATRRSAQINRLMWNDKEGMYFDYNFVTHNQSTYHFLTTFYPLWAGIASQEQAERLRSNLPIFEQAGGLETSDRVTGNQWDAPYGWAPLHILAVEGLRRYGFSDDANRISRKFLSVVIRDFQAHGTIKEKYDMATGQSNLAAGLKFGYTSNEAGFGWTNAAAVLFAHELAQQHKLAAGLQTAVPVLSAAR